jgi:uncharacterized SAM-binding protein YcdF (DUF218 family)
VLVRLGLVVLGLVVAYVAVTFVQVLSAARADERGPTGAIVVLGAAQYDGRPSPVLQARLDHALELYREGVAPVVVLTGAKQPGDRFTEAFAGFRYLRRAGVPEDALVIVDDGHDTWDSLAATARVLRRRGVERVTLVSDAYHDRRLQGVAGELGLEASVSPVPGTASLPRLVRETALVSVGQVVGYGRLLRWLG